MRKSPLNSSTGTKFLIAISGLGLFAYLLLHLAGNLLVFAGPSTFNNYSHTLVSSPITLALEAALLLVFLAHIYKAITNYVANRKARPVGYHKQEWAGKPSRRSPSSWTMIITGTITLLFILIHLKGFRFGTEYHVEGTAVRDLYRTEMENFRNPVIVAFYLLAMVTVGFHTWHGFWSACQSLGLGNSRYTPRLIQIGKAVTGVIMGGFVFIILWAYLVGQAAYFGSTP